MEYKIDEFGHCSIPEGTKLLNIRNLKTALI